MMRSLFSGVTGLRSHQTRMDVIGNNIANVNTMGFKKSTVTFKDLYSETISRAAAASGVGASAVGGVNAKQIGLGAAVDSINVVHTPGSAQYTGNNMDVAISGDGYFIVQTPSGNNYTRAGNFRTDLAGNLIVGEGYYVQTVPAIQEAVEVYTLDDLGEGKLVARSIDRPSGGVIRSGNVTADLAEISGKSFMFKYEPSDPAWKAEMSTGGYFPVLESTTDADGNPTGLNVVGVNGRASANWTSSQIEAIVLPIVENDPNAMAGVHDLRFEWVPNTDNALDGPGTINLMVGNLTLGSVNWADDLAASGNVTIDFDATGSGLDAMEITNNNANALTGSELVKTLNGAKSRPSVSVEEQGTWQMVNKDNPGEIIDTVQVAATSAAGGGYMGEFKIITTEMGQFTLKMTKNIANMQQLSDELSESSITPTVSMEWDIGFTPPTTVQESGLSTLTVDFDLYSTLGIDQNGGIVVQLNRDQQFIIDGQTINKQVGDKIVLGYIPLANFNNPSGLEKVGDNLFDVSDNSGEPVMGMPGTGSAGSLSPSNLEMSNVDLSEEIVNMIITQRGFQANTRIITTTDTMLEELVNLKR